MLKSLTPQPKPKLVCLCQARDWEKVRRRVGLFPHEATPSHTAIRGTSSTVLSIALRLGAPKIVLEDLQRANPHQVGVTHKSRGGLLHDALRCRAPDDVLETVFRWTIEYQQSLIGSYGSNRNRQEQSHFMVFQQVHIQENRVVDDNLLGARDDLGRTVLHCLVESIQTNFFEPQRQQRSMHLFHVLLQVQPDLVGATDSDGNTPMVLALQQPKSTIPALASQLEAVIHQMTKTMIDLSPAMAFHVKSLARPGRVANSEKASTMRSPLYHATLHGRHERTVETLIEGYRQIGVNGCSTIVTPHYEVCLHVAVTMRAPPSELRLIANEYPRATTAGDVFGLNPIDWLWITHVKGWHGQGSRPSRRRYLGREYVGWHDMVSKIPNRPSQYDILDSATVNELQQDMIDRIEAIVPLAAMPLLPTNEMNEYQSKFVSSSSRSDLLIEERATNLLHYICLIRSCCLGMVKLVLGFHARAPSFVRGKDTLLGRLPLHYAAARITGYTARLPIGAAARDLHYLQELSPAFEVLKSYPDACQVVDDHMQLPLHVAIDSAKEARSQCGDEEDVTLVDAEEDLLAALLHADPSSLGKRDGLTRLFPWQQAAVGNGSSLTTIYRLIRREPTYFGLPSV